MSRIRVGIIGTGISTGIAAAHLKGYLMAEDTEFIGVYNRNTETSRRWLERGGLGGDLAYEDADALIRDADAVSICTPNSAHLEYVKKCLDAGTHFLCEKPLCCASADWDAMDLRPAEGVVGMINFNYRQLPGAAALRELIASGMMGRIYTVRHAMGAPRLANENVPLEWRFRRALSGTGAIGDFGSHALDMLCYLLDEKEPPFTAATARKATFIPKRQGTDGPEPVENDDAFMVLAGLPGGGMYSLTVSRVGVASATLEVVGERAIASFDLMKPDRLRIQTRPAGGGYGAPQEIVPEATGIWAEQSPLPAPYKACAANVLSFLDCVRSGKQPETDLDYGYHILRTIEALDSSAAED